MINDQAKRLLEINNPEDFKVFSRKSLIYNLIEDCGEYQVNEHYIQQGIFDQLKFAKKDEIQKNSLENKLIQIFKKSLSSNQKNMKNSNLLKEKYSQIQQKRLSLNANNGTTKNYSEDSFYALYQKSEGQTFQKLSIKASTFQNQTDCYCCLVIEEMNDSQRHNILQNVARDNKQNFFEFCLYLGDLKNKIIQGFANKVKEIDIQISYIKCDPYTLINTQADKLMQLIINLIENSIQFQTREKVQNSFQKNINEFSQIIMQNQIIEKENLSNQKSNSNQCEKVFISNNLGLNLNSQLLNQQKIKQEVQIQEEDSKSIFKMQYPNSSNNFDEFYQQNKILDSNQVEIKFELLIGEQELSNVIKVTVKDYGIGASLSKILKMLEILNTKNTDFSSEYQNNSFLGWKINYHIIGNLGPFYNFFVKSQEDQLSLEQSNKSFYNINRIDELKELVKRSSNISNLLKKSRKISNQFTEYSCLYYKSQSIYQQNLNLNKLNSQLSKQNTERVIQNSTYNTQRIYKFIKDKVKINDNLQNSKSCQYI
ncbi:hypothetical protein TTHERM_00483450 (macronuclear) [Tetrahymena thermophila SB210]|uniref:Uncharacterized protein n=1 Tax=Tetrahymena thermophila (strain SB210) TaxID=312017 RepID=I7M1N0_TETTS|nr:hypothetical protein TTHERM_00483450 [Tetrahymena thermophila SB210]EAR97213.2 hypothetical protein TTHERM_00483450 [Tetrahymena thermophila SB210]|eukprot:XP_001017458.2 hypothetical protein TTHERM_00483450 [Tetrahymena thermophila SB210]